ncbi:MAG: hypothetical protein ABWY45_25965 [Mycobacterium sp.]
MAEQWELVLHHSFVGTPGVIVDRSPRRRGHGRAIGIPDERFLVDGATEGSGAVDLSAGGRIDVPVVADAWSPLLGVRIDVVCIRDHDVADGGTLFWADTFGTGVSPDGNMRGHFDNNPDEFAGVTSGGTGGSGGHPVLQTGKWSTISFVYDGFFSCYWTLDGVALPWITDPLTPIVPPRTIRIGQSGGSNQWMGRIDDVKVWRLNPHAIDDDFMNRPMDPAVRDCWAQWYRRLDEVLRADAECAQRAIGLLNSALTSLMHDLFSTGAYTRPELLAAAQRYQELWRQGRLAEIPAVLADLLAWLRTMGFDPRTNAAVAAAVDDDCVRRIGELLTIDCDPQFSAMLDGVLLP